MAKTVLNGITWGHSRGITPLLAYSQRFSELNPGVEINWQRRTLQEFADFPIEKLTTQYDLLIIDHPWVGAAAALGCVLPLDDYLSKDYLCDQLANSVGNSHLSYYYNDHQWALAIDAATPSASYRPDLFLENERQVPASWSQVLELAKEGKVAVPGIAVDVLMNFYMFCIANGAEPFMSGNEVIDHQTGSLALETMKELYNLVDQEMFNSNPIAVAEVMTKTDDYWYCPFAYCYSNYSRDGYAENMLLYTDLVTFSSGDKFRSTIGGTGLAVSAFSAQKDLAVKFAEQIVSPKCQSTFYVQHGGQPGHKLAWINENANELCNNFFKHVLPTMERGYTRPRYHGYLHFQDHAGHPIREYLQNGGDVDDVLREINILHKESLSLSFK